MLKEGISPVTVEVGIELFDLNLFRKEHPKPPNTVELVLSSYGQDSYYKVRKANGSIEYVPVDFKVKQRIVQRFADGPKSHL